MSEFARSLPIKRPHRVRMVCDGSISRRSHWPVPMHQLDLVYPGTRVKTARAVLAEMTAVFDRLNVVHCIADGTLLGFVREGSFINGDNDIDIRFDRKCLTDKLIATFQQAGFALTHRYWTNGQPTNMSLHKDGIALDMLGVDILPEHCIYHLTKYPRCMLTYRVPFSGVTRRDFDGLTLSVPEHPERDLVACYGPDWHQPTAHWHHHFSHQALFQCTGRLRDLLSCAFNLEEGQRCLNGGDYRTRPWTVPELARVARAMASVRPVTAKTRPL